MPVAGVGGSECPFQTSNGEASLYLRVFGYVEVIIIIDKLMIFYGPEDSKGYHNEYKAN
jgi:hypothetical protein